MLSREFRCHQLNTMYINVKVYCDFEYGQTNLVFGGMNLFYQLYHIWQLCNLLDLLITKRTTNVVERLGWPAFSQLFTKVCQLLHYHYLHHLQVFPDTCCCVPLKVWVKFSQVVFGTECIISTKVKSMDYLDKSIATKLGGPGL